MGFTYDYDPDRDTRYQMKGYDREMIRALGRLTLNASYLEGSMRILFARILNNDDLTVGERVTANGGFQWLVDHTRALSELKLDENLHALIADWLARARSAYDRRNRIVHSDHGWSFADGGVEMLWMRSNAKRSSFQSVVEPAAAEAVHEVAQELELLALEGVRLMAPVQKGAAGEDWVYPEPDVEYLPKF